MYMQILLFAIGIIIIVSTYLESKKDYSMFYKEIAKSLKRNIIGCYCVGIFMSISAIVLCFV